MSWEIRPVGEFTAEIIHDGIHIGTITQDEAPRYDNGEYVVRYVMRGRDVRAPNLGQRHLSSRISLTSADIIVSERWSGS